VLKSWQCIIVLDCPFVGHQCPFLSPNSAVAIAQQAHHFFKVGEARAQARGALLSLAAQLAQSLPGFLDAVTPVVAEHGAGTSLGLLDTFTQCVDAVTRF
jgi:hypothetical protein